MHTGKKVATFQERFTDLFNESDKTIIELAKDLHVANQTISAWKTGQRSPKEPTIITIAQYFGVKVEWLMGFDVEKEAKQGRMVPESAEMPQTIEAQLLARGVDQMPKEQREQALAMFKLMFAKYADHFDKEDSTNDA